VNLHAVIGLSKGPLTGAILSHEWEKVYLYCDSEDSYLDFLDKLGRTKKIEDMGSGKSEEYEFRGIPSLDRDTGDKWKLVEGCIDRLGNYGKADQDDVIFFSGTETHLTILISILGIRNVMSLAEDSNSFVVEGPVAPHYEKPKEYRLSRDGLLEIHGLEIEDGRIKNLGIGEESLHCHYKISDSKGRIELDWGNLGAAARKAIEKRTGSSPTKRLRREDFSIFVRGCDRRAGSSILHYTTDEKMILWLRRADKHWGSWR